MYMQGNKQLEAVASSFSKESVIGEQSVSSHGPGFDKAQGIWSNLKY